MPLFDNKLPIKFHLPEIIKGPWTREARQHALDREMLEHYVEYFGRAMQLRNWSPWHNFPLDEMRQWGHKLGQETVRLVEGFLGVEEYVGEAAGPEHVHVGESGQHGRLGRQTARHDQSPLSAEELSHSRQRAWAKRLVRP